MSITSCPIVSASLALGAHLHLVQFCFFPLCNLGSVKAVVPTVALYQNHVGSFKAYWWLFPSPREFHLINLGCSLNNKIFQSFPGDSNVQPRLRTTISYPPLTFFHIPWGLYFSSSCSFSATGNRRDDKWSRIHSTTTRNTQNLSPKTPGTSHSHKPYILLKSQI